MRKQKRKKLRALKRHAQQQRIMAIVDRVFQRFCRQVDDHFNQLLKDDADGFGEG